MQLKFAKLGALFSRFDSALRTPRFALALALAFAALAPFCGHAANPLPDGYRRIAYIESSVAGQQYIQLDYIKYRFQIPNEITIKGMYTEVPTTWQSPCGFSSEGHCNIAIRPSDHTFGNDYLGRISDGCTLANGALVTITWTVGRPANNMDGQVLNVAYPSGDPKSLAKTGETLMQHDELLTLFAVRSNSDGSMLNFSNFRLYGATVKQNGELKADLVPVLDPSDVPGLWDNVTGQFLTTQGATPFVHPEPEQWFRFKLLKKNKGVENGNGVHIGELALYTAGNVNVAEELQWYPAWRTKVTEEEARDTLAGYFSFTDGSVLPEIRWQDKLFDGKFGKDGDEPCEYSEGVPNASPELNYTFTIHLDSTKGEVVKYNLMSGKDVNVHDDYALTEWTLERSYDGVNWEYVDEQRDRNTSGWTLKNNTWYRDGGDFSSVTPWGTIADHPPTNFYWLFDLPLPKLSRTVYAHTGAPISPEIVEQSQYYTLSGDTVATQVGKYKIVCTPEPGLAWENGSTEPCELEWEIVNDPFPLPADYTRLEWIKSTRQQRLVTDYFPNPKTWMEVDCMFTGLFDGNGGTWSSGLPDCTSRFCDANEGNAPYSIAFTDSHGTFNMLICWVDPSVSGGIWLNSASFPQAGDITKAVDESVCRNLLTISNGVDKSTLEWTKAGLAIDRGTMGIERPIPSKTTTCTKRLALFGTAEKNFGTYDMTVWSWKIYESDSGSGVNDPTSHLVHNFIPAMDPDGVPGLWDTVTGEFRASDTDTQFDYKPADQWFRLKITQVAPGKAYLAFSEFALYDAEGVRQNLGLTEASSIDHIGPGQFFHDKRKGSDQREGSTWGDSPTVYLFDGDLGEVNKRNSRMGMDLPSGTYDSTGKITDPQVLIMHLQSGANEVVKYSLASGDYGVDFSPTGWILERSYDGRNWTEIIRKTMATSEYATGYCSWYRDGGGDAAPTTFYPAGNWGEGANQWFRLTIRKKHLGTDAYGLNSLQLDEFALFDAEGKRQDIGLEPNGVSAASLLPGEWYYEGRGDEAGTPTKFWAGQSPSKLFDRNLATKWGVDYALSNLSPLGNGDPAYWQVLTLRLPVWTSEVVSYNLCSGSDTGNYPSRAPTSWVLERSADGINWVVFDEKTEEDNQYTLESSTWYGNGGKDKDPTNVFWIVKLPLPKLGQTVYSYTGAPISPKMMEESEFYTLSGVTNATAVGTYKLVCTPISGLTWANGSTGPYELVWEIVPETFLQRVASDPKRVDGETVDYDTGYASGGDIVLQIGNEYVHVFTNGTDRTFTAKTELANARILVVGGGGSGGLGWNGFSGAGGGAGGLVEMVTSLSQETYQVKVGIGAQSVTDVTHPRGKNGSDSLFSRMSGDAIALAQGGGGGGSSAISYVGSGKSSNCDLAIGLSGGSGGGHSVLYEDYIDENFPSADWYSPAPGVDGQGYAGGMAYINTASAQGCSGAGGGGAGGAGAACTKTTVGGVGGVGRVSDILGWSAFFAGGGAGAAGNINFAESSNGGVGGGGSSCSREILTNATYAAKRPLIMDGSNGQGGGGAGAVSREMNVVGDSGKGGDGIVIIRYQIPDTTLQATPPVAKTGLTYNGKTQVGVPEGVGYTLKEAYYYATAVGTYTTTATLLPGYVWNDNGSTAPRDYEWTIEGLRISSVKLVASEAQWTGSAITPQVASVTTVDGLTFTDASVGWTVSFERERVETDNLTDIGNVSVVVTGKGSLSGEARANFRIYDPHKIPLPKPSLAVYKYTGFAITPTFDPSWARAGYEKSGTLSATAKGTNTVTCTLKPGYEWENGSKAPYDVQWVIGDSFLERLANDERKVAQSEATYATGGDVILHDADQGVYIHAFTNCNNATAAFTAISALSGVEMLLVGGGGGGGYARGSRGGGGGAGGLVHIEGASLAAGSYGITVGKGGSGGWQHDQAKGYTAPSGTDSAIRDLSGLSWLTAFGGGGGGGSSFSQYTGNGAAGAAGGCGGGNAGHCPVTTPAVGSQGGNGGVTGSDMAIGGGGGGAGGDGQSYTGSAQALNGGNGVECRILDTSEWFAGGGAGGQIQPHQAPTASGGKGGGGSTCLQQDRDKRDVLWTGEDGLGGGGAGSTGSTDITELNGGRGGSGIVIIRYADPVNGLVAPVPEGGRVIYNGKTQVGVVELPGSTLSGNYYGDEVGHYTAVATLAPGYTKWSDGKTDLWREITWEIYVPSVEASAEDVEQEYDGNSHSITVTVTDPVDATVTYSLTEDGEYTPSNPSFTKFGAYRVYWKASKDNYTGAKGSAVVRIGKKAAGEYVRLRITQRTGGRLPWHTQSGGVGEWSIALSELALYSDVEGNSRIGSGLTEASDLNALISNRNTCFFTLPDLPKLGYGQGEFVRLFDGTDGANHYSIVHGVDAAEPRTSTNAHLLIYMHLSAADKDKVIRSYNLESASIIERAGSPQTNSCPTAWRLEVSSDCRHWTVIDEKTVADTAGNEALKKDNTWYGRDESGNAKPYPINLDYAPLEYLDTNPGEPNYLQVVGFQLEEGNAVTARVQYDGALSSDKDTLFCQRDLDGKGTFAVGRSGSGSGLWLDYGTASGSGATLTDGIVELVAGASGLTLNGESVIAAPGTALTAPPNNSLLLFASDDPTTCDGVPAVNAADLKCYGFQVANSATDPTLRLDLMPASNTVTHAHGLYDRVSGNFYPLQKVAEAGKQPFTSATIASHYAKPMTVKMNDAGWTQLPILTEVDERLASGTNYLTSIPFYWQQEWEPGVVDRAGEYRQILRGQGPYAGEVTNVYAVGIEVALSANGGTAGATNSVLAVPGRSLPAITGAGALPTMTDSMFAGYWSEQTGGEKYYNADGTSAKDYPATDGPTTLYAHWRQGIKPLADNRLHFDGKHFILTDYVPKTTTWIETEMQAKRKNTTEKQVEQSFFGLAETHEIGSSSCTLYYGMNYAGYSALIYGWALSSGNNEGEGRGWSLSESYGAMLSNGKCLVQFGYSGFAVSNQTYGIKEATQDLRMNMQDYFPCTSTLVIGGLGGALPADSSTKEPGYGRPVQPYRSGTDDLDVYSFKIYESENGDPKDAVQTLVRNYIPVTNTVDKVAGLYDVINEVFYPLKTQTIVTLNANGGNQPTNYVYATAGEAMPSPIAVPTRPGYTFKGYVEKWEARLMTGDDTDICNEGASEFAMMIGTPPASPCSINGVNFVQVTAPASFDRMPMPNLNLGAAACETEDKGNSGYGQLLNGCLWGGGLSYSFELKELTPGHVYLFQFFVHDGSKLYGRRDFKVSVDNVNWYSVGCDPAVSDPTRSRYGVTFIHRFEAQSATESVTIYYKDDYVVFNGAQLRDITGEPSANVFYYDAYGKSLRTYPVSGGPTTLTAMWEPAKYRMINRETGPERAVDYEWLNGVFGENDQAGYQEALFETNANGVVAWQAYILGVDAAKTAVDGAAIVEETVQNASPETVTIRLRGMPTEPRTNATTRLAYSLLSARTPEGLLNGGGTVVRDLNDNQFERCEQSTFEAPLKDLTDEEPVNYYRIKVHFIFDK